ncbi:hypothetical protein ACGFZQ_12180 [Streptomyces sp. NPDC048254]|uniref:hypothetical protein n=1 Tax=Streptomyces sp. NPDC048254 TaxID=3365525 RepID=UPI003717AEC2
MRGNIKRAATVVGALTAAAAMLGQGVAQAAPISRTTGCARFTGDYTYWSDGTGWYGYSLNGTITRTCSGSAVHGIQVTGDWKGHDFYYDYEGHRLSKGESVNLIGFYEAYDVRNIRIVLD